MIYSIELEDDTKLSKLILQFRNKEDAIKFYNIEKNKQIDLTNKKYENEVEQFECENQHIKFDNDFDNLKEKDINDFENISDSNYQYSVKTLSRHNTKSLTILFKNEALRSKYLKSNNENLGFVWHEIFLGWKIEFKKLKINSKIPNIIVETMTEKGNESRFEFFDENSGIDFCKKALHTRSHLWYSDSRKWASKVSIYKDGKYVKLNTIGNCDSIKLEYAETDYPYRITIKTNYGEADAILNFAKERSARNFWQYGMEWEGIVGATHDRIGKYEIQLQRKGSVGFDTINSIII